MSTLIGKWEFTFGTIFRLAMQGVGLGGQWISQPLPLGKSPARAEEVRRLAQLVSIKERVEYTSSYSLWSCLIGWWVNYEEDGVEEANEIHRSNHNGRKLNLGLKSWSHPSVIFTQKN